MSLLLLAVFLWCTWLLVAVLAGIGGDDVVVAFVVVIGLLLVVDVLVVSLVA